MIDTKVNLHNELLKARNKSRTSDKLLKDVFELLNKNEEGRLLIKNKIKSGNYSDSNNFNFDLLKTENIFHVDQIRTICINYRLRFLDSNLFLEGIPEEAISKINNLEKEHQTSINGFKIVAPSKTFNLKSYDDPLLFVPIGNNYYYLIHKWGNDLNKIRKWQFSPVKNIENFLVFSLFTSILVTLLTPETNLSRQVPMASFIVFLFAFKSIVGVALYYFFMMGKNFNSEIWNREFKEN